MERSHGYGKPTLIEQNEQLRQRVVELEQSDRKRDVKLLQTLAKMFNYTGLASQFTLLALKRESGEWKPELGD